MRRFDAATYGHVPRAIGCILENGPDSQERWENAEGYSPATIAAEIAALVAGGTSRGGTATRQQQRTGSRPPTRGKRASSAGL